MAAPPPPPTTADPLPHSHPPPPESQHHHPPRTTLRIGTRSSALALAQVSLFTSLLPSSTPTSTHPFSTQLGDTNKTTSLHTLASTGKSLWTEDLEAELLAGRVDVLVHSLKDVPTKLLSSVGAAGGRGGGAGCKVRAYPPRGEKRDCVLLAGRHRRDPAGGALASQPQPGGGGGGGGEGGGGSSSSSLGGLRDLPPPARVGTSSVRRAAMLRRSLPGVEIVDCRGNVGTRIRKLDRPTEQERGELGYDALVLAGAGVQRLGLGDRIDGWLGWEDGIGHAVGQGAVGVEWREGDEWVEGMLEALEDGMEGAERRRVRWEGEAERALLRVLEGGCSVPVGVDCRWEEYGGAGRGGLMMVLRGMVVSVDGKKCVEGEKRKLVRSDADAEECGMQCAQELVEKGAEEILKEIELNRSMLRGQDNA